jgi:hypothetical protein
LQYHQNVTSKAAPSPSHSKQLINHEKSNHFV